MSTGRNVGIERPRTAPTQGCDTCGDWEEVRPDGRGFPPRIAERRLRLRCRAAGHDPVVSYRAGVSPELLALMEANRRKRETTVASVDVDLGDGQVCAVARTTGPDGSYHRVQAWVRGPNGGPSGGYLVDRTFTGDLAEFSASELHAQSIDIARARAAANTSA